MEKSLAILGTGAIGSSIGLDLTAEGYNVVLIDQWPAHIEAMKQHGLCVNIRAKGMFQVPVHAIHLCELAELKRQFEIVFLTCKSNDSCWMAQLIKPYLRSDGVLVSVQNSFNDEWLVPIIGYERDIACSLELAAEVFEPGLVKRNTDRDHTRFVLGELDGRITPRVQEVANILSAVGKTSVSANIMGVKWTKLVLNSMNMSTDTIAGIRQWELIHNPKYWDFLIKLGKETVSVATALGYKLEPFPGVTEADFLSSPEESLKEFLFNLMSDVGPEAYSCVQQDAMKGRLLETRFLNGFVVKKGQEAGVPTPANEAVVALIEQIEQGKIKPGIQNIDKLASSR